MIQINDKVVIKSDILKNSVGTVKSIGFSEWHDEYYYLIETEDGCLVKCLLHNLAKVKGDVETITLEQYDKAVEAVLANLPIHPHAHSDVYGSLLRMGFDILRNKFFPKDERNDNAF